MATTEKKPTASPSKRAKDRREQQLQQQKRNQQLLLGILAVAFLIGVAFSSAKPPGRYRRWISISWCSQCAEHT